MPHPVEANVITANPAHAQPQRNDVILGNCIKLEGEQRARMPYGKGDIAFITLLNTDGMFGTRWVLANPGEKNVRPQQIVELDPIAVMACCTSTSNCEHPSILALLHCCTVRCVRLSTFSVMPPCG